MLTLSYLTESNLITLCLEDISTTHMRNSETLAEKHEKNRQQRYEFIIEWAEYVRTHPDDDWGEQVKTLVNSQIESAQHFEDIRPDLDEIDSLLLDE